MRAAAQARGGDGPEGVRLRRRAPRRAGRCRNRWLERVHAHRRGVGTLSAPARRMSPRRRGRPAARAPCRGRADEGGASDSASVSRASGWLPRLLGAAAGQPRGEDDRQAEEHDTLPTEPSRCSPARACKSARQRGASDYRGALDSARDCVSGGELLRCISASLAGTVRRARRVLECRDDRDRGLQRDHRGKRQAGGDRDGDREREGDYERRVDSREDPLTREAIRCDGNRPGPQLRPRMSGITNATPTPCAPGWSTATRAIAVPLLQRRRSLEPSRAAAGRGGPVTRWRPPRAMRAVSWLEVSGLGLRQRREHPTDRCDGGPLLRPRPGGGGTGEFAP